MSRDGVSRAVLPDAIVDKAQWVCWREQTRDGKATKVPVDPSTGTYASTTDSETWATFDAAVEYATTESAAGIGFVFTDEGPFVGVDLDDCRGPETGTTEDWANEIIEQLDSYTEISPSGTGYHVLIRGSLPEGRNRHGDVELYETARFFTVTGNRVGGQQAIRERTDELAAIHAEYVKSTALSADDDAPAAQLLRESTDEPTSQASGHATGSTLSDDELVEKAQNAANGEKFDRLWNGNTGAYDSHSEADMALCCLLAFWTAGESQQIDRLFRDSGLIREKWDDVHFADGSTYGEKTIERAIATTSEFYDPESQTDTRSGEAATSTPTAESQQSTVTTRKLREIVEQNADLTDRVDELAVTVETQADRIDALETRLETLEARVDRGEDTQQEGSSTLTSNEDSHKANVDDGDEGTASEPESAQTFVAQAKRLFRSDSERQ